MNFLEDYESWMVWALAICLGFPLVAIILGELGDALEDRNSIIARPIRELRNRVAPGISLLLFLHHVVGWPWDNTVVRIVATLSFVLGLSTVLAIFNGAIFKEATEILHASLLY